jgi:hypothetical protein
VVGMSLPPDQIVPFSKVYFSLFDPRTKGALLRWLLVTVEMI